MTPAPRRVEMMKRIGALYAIVLLGVEGFVTVYFWSYGFERVRFELTISLVIVSVIGLPVISYVALQHQRMKDLTEKLAHLSAVDQMSGLLNRQTFLDRLELLFFQTGKGRSAGVFAFIDGDHFKAINDRFGHAVGDKVILLIAEHIRLAARSGDLSARLGGEEFGIFFQATTLEEAAGIADRIRRDIELSGLKLGIPGFSISVSIGLSAHRAGEGALATMREADRSLYAAKREGRNAVVTELRRYRAV